jgi:glycerophosphoryl diester phosphodiesterase
MHLPARLLATFLLAAFGAAPVSAAPALPRAHAHNDYEHTRPLQEALERGFCHVEADIYLVDGKLLVAHHRSEVKPDRTLASLYLDPLLARVRRQGGRVHPDGPRAITLLIDIKTEANSTYVALDSELRRYAEMLTVFRHGQTDERAVTVLVSGNRPIAELTAQSERYAALDGRKADLTNGSPASLVPWVSENWNNAFTWRWSGPIPTEEHAQLRDWVKRAHAQGKKVRFWNTPDHAEAWRLLTEAGVDIIGTDHLDRLEAFFAGAGK